MAFLSHAIPWHSLSSMLEYGERCDPGPQHPDLFGKSKSGHRKQVEHFARKFQTEIRVHSTTERQRYKPTKYYVDRAQSWTVSGQADLAVAEPLPIEEMQDNSGHQQTSREQRSLQSRSRPANTWPTSSPERRFVYLSDFASTYMSYVPITSGAYDGRQGLVQEFAHIETWIDFTTRKAHYSTRTEDDRKRLWLDNKSCSDILRLLIIDAATTADITRRTYMIESIFLLAHHPQVGISNFISDGMWCCNINVGLTSLVEKVTVAFILLNILWTHIDGNPSSSLLQQCEHLQQFRGSYYRSSKFATLLPRPAYMNTQSYNNMMNTVLQEHGHVVQHVFFNPLLAPYSSGRRSKYFNSEQTGSRTEEEDMRRERDVFTDLPALKQALKQMWKMMVYCDMLFREIGQPINWEYVVIDSISLLFQGKGGFERLMGMAWVEYDLSRNEFEVFRFFAAVDVNDKVL